MLFQMLHSTGQTAWVVMLHHSADESSGAVGTPHSLDKQDIFQVVESFTILIQHLQLKCNNQETANNLDGSAAESGHQGMRPTKSDTPKLMLAIPMSIGHKSVGMRLLFSAKSRTY